MKEAYLSPASSCCLPSGWQDGGFSAGLNTSNKKQSADPNNLIKITVTGKLKEIGQNQRKQTALKIEFKGPLTFFIFSK